MSAVEDAAQGKGSSSCARDARALALERACLLALGLFVAVALAVAVAVAVAVAWASAMVARAAGFDAGMLGLTRARGSLCICIMFLFSFCLHCVLPCGWKAHQSQLLSASGAQGAVKKPT